MSAITTHILDTSVGKPAANVEVELEILKGEKWTPLGNGLTDADGRVKDLIKDSQSFVAGRYRISFAVESYFKAQKVDSFYPYVKIVFEVKETDSHYHVPLLLNPFGYSTYRGS